MEKSLFDLAIYIPQKQLEQGQMPEDQTEYKMREIHKSPELDTGFRTGYLDW